MSPRVVNILTTTIGGGGAEKQLLLSVLGLSRRGVSCRVFGMRATDNTRYRSLMEDCQAAGASFHLPQGAGLLPAAEVLSRLVVDTLRAPSCVLWLWGFRAQLLKLLLPPLWIPRCVVSLRAADPGVTRAQQLVTRLGHPLTWRYLSNSQRAVDIMESRVPGVAARSMIVGNAVEDISSADAGCGKRRSGRELQVVMLGNIRYLTKGYDVALEIAERIRAEDLPVRLRIGGKQYAGEPDLAAEIARRDLSSVVSFVGEVHSPRAFLQTGDVFLLLSRSEGMPNSLMEAMALGIPCISTDVGDVASFCEEVDSVRVVPVLEVAGVVEQLRAWTCDWSDAQRLGARARSFASSQFGIDRMLNGVEAVLGVNGEGADVRPAAKTAAA